MVGRWSAALGGPLKRRSGGPWDRDVDGRDDPDHSRAVRPQVSRIQRRGRKGDILLLGKKRGHSTFVPGPGKRKRTAGGERLGAAASGDEEPRHHITPRNGPSWRFRTATLATARRQTRAALLAGIIETGRPRRIDRRKRRPTGEQSSSVARSRRPGPRRATGRSGVVQGVTGPATRRVFASSK